MSSRLPSRTGFSFSNLKLANQITLIAGFLAIAILATLTIVASRYSSHQMSFRAQQDFKSEVQSLSRTADLAYRLAESTAEIISRMFDRDVVPNVTVDMTQTMLVGDQNVHIVKSGDTVLNLNHDLLDNFTEATDAIVSVMVREGDDFVRVASSYRDSKGNRMTGTLLSKDNPAYHPLINGIPYFGLATLSDTKYMVKYWPIRAQSGDVIAALVVGTDLTGTMHTLFDAIGSAKFGDTGYAYVVDVSPGADYGKMLAHPELVGQRVQDIQDAEGNAGALTPVLDEDSGVFTYDWVDEQGTKQPKFVAFDRSEPWGWVIAGGSDLKDFTKIGEQLGQLLVVVGAVSAVILAMLLWLAIRQRMKPLVHLREIVHQLTEGDDEARANLKTRDEVGELGSAFDQMMDERVATQRAIQQENEQLNASVLSLLQAVAQLSRKDLTVKVPVTEDVTGAVADALNLLTAETGRVLQEVSDISADVTAASLKVKEQADAVIAVAGDEQQAVDDTADSLAHASASMNEIAELAKVCNDAADNAIRTTQQALETVTNTVGGINSTREVIRETEKRIKRLGERSQEISGVVNLINTIAERTHILALNASMHAASAGEAGRGFAVVADEVQRLAESSRNATAQIATLVNSIQVETADTVNTMNATIAQVVEGSKLAEQAGEQMQTTQSTTAELVSLVQKIADSSQQQAKVNEDLMERAARIRESTEHTSRQLQEQGQYTNNLVEYAKNLLATIRVFKLPG